MLLILNTRAYKPIVQTVSNFRIPLFERIQIESVRAVFVLVLPRHDRSGSTLTRGEDLC
jgi:hypothetical protein